MNSCVLKYKVIILFLLLSTTDPAIGSENIKSDDSNTGISLNDPSYAPAHPYLLAFTKVQDHKRTLHLLNQSNQTEYEISTTAITSNGSLDKYFTGRFDRDKTDLDFYSGELHWRPVLDVRGRQWYIYIASTSSAELVLHFNYLNRDGTPSGESDIRFNFQGEIRYPKWSPDGRMIAFSSRNQIYIIPDISPVIISQEVSGLVPVRHTQAGTGNLYPDWSPSGRHIAYQSVNTETGVRNSGINIITIDRDNPGRISVPVRVTSHLYNYHEYLPSWAPDENYIAYYINQDPLYEAQVSDKLDIGITQLFTNPRTGEIIGGRTGLAAAQRIATNVVACNNVGPEWIYLDEGNPASLSLLFISVDQDNSQRVRYARINEFFSNNSSFVTEFNEATSLNESHKVKSFNAIEIDQKLRFTQVVSDNRTTGFHSFEHGTNYSPPVILQERQRSEAIWRSALIPGFGQYYKGQYAKSGLFFGTSALIAGTNLYLFFIERPRLKDDRDDVQRAITQSRNSSERRRLENQLGDLRSSIDSNKNMILAGTALFAGIYALNIFDSSLGFPITVQKQVNSGTIRGEFGPRYINRNAELGFSIHFDF